MPSEFSEVKFQCRTCHLNTLKNSAGLYEAQTDTKAEENDEQEEEFRQNLPRN
jgi:hypothetical protein